MNTVTKEVFSIHASFLEAGCEVIETNTFGANRAVLEEYGLGDKAYEINWPPPGWLRKLPLYHGLLAICFGLTWTGEKVAQPGADRF